MNTTFPDGTRELLDKGVNSKMYPNGIIKISWPDGQTQTRFPDGTMRVQDGKVV